MILLKLGIILAVIVVLLCLTRPLYLAITVGMVATALLFAIDWRVCLQLVWKGLSNYDTIVVVSGLYLITYLQRMLEKRQQLRKAQQDLDDVFHNRRINASLAPIFIVLLPSAAAVNICGEIVQEACKDDLKTEEKAFVTSYYRHIPESFLPTYPSVILMAQLSGVAMASLVLGMVPLVIVLYLLGYVFYLRKVPRRTAGAPPVQSGGGKAWLRLLQHLWTLFLVVLLILLFNAPIYIALGVAIVCAVFVYRFRWQELRPMFKSAFEFQMLLNSALVMVFREFIQYSGAISQLPDILGHLPIPTAVIFAIIYFIGALMIGNNAIVAMITAMAFSVIPAGGMPLAVLLMAFTYAAMQVSPTHYCLFVAIDYFKTDFGKLIRCTVLPILCYMGVTLLYYGLLTLMF